MEWKQFLATRTRCVILFTELAKQEKDQRINPSLLTYMFAINLSLASYKNYNKEFAKKLQAEVTIANAISLSRIPILIVSFAVAKDRPRLLATLLTVVYALDAADGYVARRWGLGNSPYGANIDIISDHLVELLISFQFAYTMRRIPKTVPWILLTRNVIIDFLRLYNFLKPSSENGEKHPHKAFGTFDRIGRALSGITKATEAIVIPLKPALGLSLSIAHILISFYRAFPVLTSKTSQQIYSKLLSKFETASKPS